MSVAILLLCGTIFLQISYYRAREDGTPAAEEASARSAPDLSASLPSPGQPCKPWNGDYATKSLSTPWGSRIEVREFGSVGCSGVIMIHGKCILSR